MREVFRANARGVRDVVGRGLEARAHGISRLAAQLAPIDKGILRASAKVSQLRRNQFRITFRRRVNASRFGRGFDIAFWLHEARNPNDMLADHFSYTPSISQASIDAATVPTPGGTGIDLMSVGRKYLERASLASVEFVRLEISRDLQQFFDQNETASTGDALASRRRFLSRRGRRTAGGPARTTRAIQRADETRGLAGRNLKQRIERNMEDDFERLSTELLERGGSLEELRSLRERMLGE